MSKIAFKIAAQMTLRSTFRARVMQSHKSAHFLMRSLLSLIDQDFLFSDSVCTLWRHYMENLWPTLPIRAKPVIKAFSTKKSMRNGFMLTSLNDGLLGPKLVTKM